MVITRLTDEINIRYAYLNIFPDQFVSEAKKQNPSWVKNTMDYFANAAFAQYRKHRETFSTNYDLLKGIIDYKHFYENERSSEVQSLTDTLMRDTELPAYVKHYPIINPPVNTLVGELSKRPDLQKVRAFDDDSKSEELEVKSNILEQAIIQQGTQMLILDLSMKGQDVSQLQPQQLQQMTMDKVQDYLMNYTSTAESWGNHVLLALKMEFRMKEKSEDAFRDLLITSREFFHIFEDNSKLGFNIEVLNPKNQWQLGTPDVKYTSAVSGEQSVPYAIGSAQVMEISEIIEKFPDLSKEEIDHLRTSLQDYGLINVRESNLTSGKTGYDSINYDTYNRLILQERMMVESEMKENKDELRDWLGLSNSTASFGYKYTVVRSYWTSKKKVGLVTYQDENGDEQQQLVDETYKKSPNQLAIQWGWINQWYQGVRIGPDIYHVKPFKLLDYSPIIGVIHEVKNTTARSLVDLMKPFQVLYNICMNQLFQLLEKEKGVVQLMSIRHIPTPKDGDAQDAIDIWEEEAKKRGVVFIDDSPENLKAPSSFNQYMRLDLTRTQEIDSRYRLASQLKSECWELVGMNRQRLGAPLATETATANQNALVQSFAQTEPYFAAHEYLLNQVYQAILDAAQYVESSKPTSTISYITNQGESAFIQINGSDLKLKDLKVFVTSRPEDQQLINEFRQLAQPMLQNGASVYDISVLYTTNSVRQMQKTFKSLADKQDAMKQQEQQLEQQKVEQEQQSQQAQLKQAEDHFQEDQQLKKYIADTSNNTKITVQEIANYAKSPDDDFNKNGIPDPQDLADHALKTQQALAKNDLENRKLNLQYQQLKDAKTKTKKDQELQQQKIDNEKARTKEMAKAKSRAKKK